MKFELTIQEMFDNYPTLFKDRADCLNHLFCVIGNGYDWVNGELVEGPEDYSAEEQKYFEDRLKDGKAFQYNRMSLRDEAIESYNRYLKRNGGKESGYDKSFNKEYFASLPDDKYHKCEERRKRWYFYINIPGHERIDYHKEFAYLWNYPEDIKPDWLAAIEETKSLLREDGFEI